MAAINTYSSIAFASSSSYLDLAKGELRNARIQNLGSAPGTPVSGQIYYDTVTGTLQVQNASAFFTVLDGGAVSQTKTGQLTLTGGLVVNTTGITGNKEINLTGVGASSVGGIFSALMLDPTGNTGATATTRYAGGVASGAPASGTYILGDFIIAQTGDVWVCTTAGTPGSWTRVGSYILGTANTWTSTNAFNGAITGNSTINLTGATASSVGGTFTGTILIASGNTGATSASRYAGGTATVAPASGTYAVGDFVVAQNGNIFVCTGAGTPGTWTQVGSYLLGATNTWSGTTNTFSNAVVLNGAVSGSGTINLTGTGSGGVAGTWGATAHGASGITGAVTATRYAGGTATVAPTTGTFITGDFVVSTNGNIWVCTAGGAPGTWVQVGSYLLAATNTWSGTSNTFSTSTVFNAAMTGSGTLNLTGTGASSFAGTVTGTAIVASGLTGAVSASRYVGATTGAAPATGTFVTGDFAIGQSGSVFICSAGGTPGTWVTLASAGTVYYQTVQNAGVSQTQRPRINFIAGTYTSKTTTDNGGNTSTDVAFDVVPGNLTINLLGATTADFSMASHKITSLLDPTNPQDAATKNYVDLARQGVEYKDSVAAATTGVLPNTPTYSNGTAGVGATLTAGSNAAFPSTIDGAATTVVGTRILVKDQAAGLQNGIYTLTTVGSGAAPWVLTRAVDNDSSTSTPPRMAAGDICFVDAGTVNGTVLYAMNQGAAITMGTTAITYTAISGATTVTAGAGLTATGNVFAVGAGTGISVGVDSVGIDTTLTARWKQFNGPSGAGVTWAITHSLGNRDVNVNVYDATTYASVMCDIVRTDANTVTLNFDSSVGINALRASIVG